MNIFDMKKERAEFLDKAEHLVAAAEHANRQMTAEEVKLFDGHMAEVNKLTKKIEEHDKVSTLHSLNLMPGSGPVAGGWGGQSRQPQSEAPVIKRGTLAEALKYAAPEEVERVKAFARYIGGDMTALADLTPSGEGEIFIPSLVAGVVERNYSAFTPVKDNCRLWPTLTGEPTKFPVISDTEEAEILAPAALTGADAVVTGDTPPTEITGPVMGAHKFSSKPVFVPREIITDSNLNVLEEVLNALLSRIYRTQNKKYTKGTGVGEPEGFLKNAVAYAAGAVALDLDVALDLAYSVPLLYRPNGIYMCSDTTVKYLRKLKTGLAGDKRALWKDAFEEGNATLGTPAKLHGYPLIVNNDMDSVAADGTFAGVNPLAFGDFRRFVVRYCEMGTPYIYRYTVPAKDGGAAIAFHRSDSKLIVPAAISKLSVA